jgi:uncharacterized membrane protein YcaP (DUF421 family)
MSLPLTLALLKQRTDLVEQLRPQDPATRVSTIETACIETGGTLIPANAPGDRNAHFAELSLLGVYHQGNDTAEVVNNWMKAVARLTKDAEGLAA